jgi:hypothetical protein
MKPLLPRLDFFLGRECAGNKPVDQTQNHQNKDQHAEGFVKVVERVLRGPLGDAGHRDGHRRGDQDTGGDEPVQQL